jgi:seryl-tRNA synthetase
MSFTVNDLNDMIQLLEQHPDWREELQRALMTDDFIALPDLMRRLTESHERALLRLDRSEAIVQELAEAQKRAEERLSSVEARLERLEATVQELVEAQKRAEERLSSVEARLDRLEATVQELVEAQKRTDQQLAELAEAQKLTEQRMAELIEAQKRTEQRVDSLDVTVQKLTRELKRIGDVVSQLLGRDLERKYRERAGSYFGKWLRPVEVVSPNDLREVLEARLVEAEVDDVMELDVLLRGRARRMSGNPEVWLVMEVSSVVDRNDIERARRRTALLCKAGYRAIPVVAGERITEGAAETLSESPLIVFEDGHGFGWEEALATLS